MNAALDWNSIYLTCFGIGLVLSVLFLATGMGHIHLGHFHFGHGHGVGAKAGHMISPFNGFTLVAFLCWFGGSGYLLHRYSGFVVPLVLGFAVLAGLAGASIVFFFLTKVLMPMERTLEPSDTEMTGVIGKLSGGIPVNGVGEIIFSQNGSRRAVAVRSDDGNPIERGAEVVVMRSQRGIAYVRRWDEFEHGLMGEKNPSRTEDATTKD
jgi:membrane protein implicated in regulation of membrane protease activity